MGHTTGTDTDPPLLFGIVSDAADTCADTDTEPTLPADTDTDTEITGNDPPADTGPADAQLTGHEPEHVHPEPDATICDTGPPADTDTVTGPDADCAPTFDTVTEMVPVEPAAMLAGPATEGRRSTTGGRAITAAVVAPVLLLAFESPGEEAVAVNTA